MLIRNETIAALATPVGFAPLALIRVSGVNTLSIIDSIFKGTKTTAESPGQTVLFGYIVNPKLNITIDQVLISIFKAPKSFTGEDMVEITCHGGLILFQKILDLLLEQGCVLAEPGEFSKRAFFNQKIDLTQAESIHDLIFSRSFKVSQLLLSSLKKNLGKKLAFIKEQILLVVAKIEVGIDYPEDGLEEFSSQDYEKIALVITEVENLIEQGIQSRTLNNGYKVALIGKTNAGKSSLLNTLVGEDKAIVSNIEGTTRDPIEVTLNLNETPITFIDTAGVRENTENEIELIGIEKSKQVALTADFIIFVQDITETNNNDLLPLIDEVKKQGTHFIMLYNKVDLIDNLSLEDTNENSIYFSCVSKRGYKELLELIKNSLKNISLTDTSFYINTRQNSLLGDLLNIIKESYSFKDSPSFEPELLSLLLQKGLDVIGDLDGTSTKEDILNMVFSQFCVGK